MSMRLGIGLGLPYRGAAGSAPAWSPASLFASGEEGAIYGPHHLFWLAFSSIVPVTAAGQTVVVALDSLQGLAGDTEFITNGTFDSDASGWNTHDGNVTLSVVDGELRVDLAGASDYAWQRFATTPGNYYEVTAYVRAGTNVTECYLQARTAGGTFIGGAPGYGTTDGQLHLLFQATTAESDIRLRSDKSATPAHSFFDNVSVREVPGAHARQDTTGSRPAYRTGPARLDFDGVDDVLAATVPDLGTTATVAYSVSGIVTYLENQTIGSGSYSLPTADWSNCLLIDRALTADEKAKLEGAWA